MSNTAAVSLIINPIVDAPDLVARSVGGSLNSPILLDVQSELRDTDGSEQLSIQIAGLPPGAFLNQGSQVSSGVYELTADQLIGLDGDTRRRLVRNDDTHGYGVLRKRRQLNQAPVDPQPSRWWLLPRSLIRS